MRFRAAALITRRVVLLLAAVPGFAFFCFAQRAFWAAEILARAEALNVRCFGLLAAETFLEPAGRPGPRRAGPEPRPPVRADIAFPMRLLCWRSSLSTSSTFMFILSTIFVASSVAVESREVATDELRLRRMIGRRQRGNTLHFALLEPVSVLGLRPRGRLAGKPLLRAHDGPTLFLAFTH